jgi:hypothetical protein
MTKKLNFFTSKQLNYLDDELDTSVGYKDTLDYAITRALQPKSKIPPGPYLGYIIRIEEIGTTDMPALDSAAHAIHEAVRWGSGIFSSDDDAEDAYRSPGTFSRYKIRIPELDTCIPEPPDLCVSPTTESPAQKFIEMHQTFYAKEQVGPLQIGQVVRVNFGDYRTREDAYIVEPYFDSNGEIYIQESNNTLEGAKSTFNNCKDITLGGAPDGSSLNSKLNFLTDGFKNIFIGDDNTVGQDSVDSTAPKNTFPRECSTKTSTGFSNTPDNQEEEDNLTYMEEEIIPRLLPALQGVDPRFQVTSVYRSDEVNQAVGGSPSSYHAKGLGVDFGGLAGLSPDDRNEIFFKGVNYLKENRSQFPFLRTVIVETFRNHIHIDIYPKGSKGSCKWRRWNNKGSKMENIA